MYYKSERGRAWRNLMVSTVNEALRSNLISMRPGDNRWPNADRGRRGEGFIYDFILPNGVPVMAFIDDAGHGELRIHAAARPTNTCAQWIRVSGAGFEIGEAVAEGWVERKEGAWLQESQSQFRCRNTIKPLLASIIVEPQGYADHGKVMM